MLFKEKLLLSNCDSVRQLSEVELLKRFTTGITFGDGVVLSPNTFIDNVSFASILTRKNLVKYLNEEGCGKLVIRGFNTNPDLTLLEYYESLPANFIFSSFTGSPTKESLTKEQLAELITRLDITQRALNNLDYGIEQVSLAPHALQEEILTRLDDAMITSYFGVDIDRHAFERTVENTHSRSEWYEKADALFFNNVTHGAAEFKNEIINPSYNSLFANKGEGFLLDDIKLLTHVPQKILDVGVTYKSLKKEMDLIKYAYKAFELITTLGSVELTKLITDEALGYIEDKMQDTAVKSLTRKNWFGMYPKMQRVIGLELK